MRSRRPLERTPDDTAPSLEGADERGFLVSYLFCWHGHQPPPGDYRLVRGLYERAQARSLPACVPARVPELFRRLAP